MIQIFRFRSLNFCVQGFLESLLTPKFLKPGLTKLKKLGEWISLTCHWISKCFSVRCFPSLAYLFHSNLCFQQFNYQIQLSRNQNKVSLWVFSMICQKTSPLRTCHYLLVELGWLSPEAIQIMGYLKLCVQLLQGRPYFRILNSSILGCFFSKINWVQTRRLLALIAILAERKTIFQFELRLHFHYCSTLRTRYQLQDAEEDKFELIFRWKLLF